MSTKRGLVPIVDKIYIKPEKDWEKIKLNLKRNRKMSHDLLSEFDSCFSNSLCETNINIIEKIKKFLDISTTILRDKKTKLVGTDRLANMCEQVSHCNVYLSGTGGKKYLDESKFSSKNIRVIYQKESEMIKKPILEYLSEIY
jgi:hypothetical protein